MPLVFASVLKLQHDVYLAIYFAFVAVLIATYTSRTGIDVGEVIRRHWQWGLLAGIVVGIPVVRNVFTENSTPHPHGFYFGFEIVWRGRSMALLARSC